MKKTRTLSSDGFITEGQIGKMQEFLSAAFRKQRSEFPFEIVQDVVEQNGRELQAGFLAVVRSCVERRLGIIKRQVTVNRDRTPEQAIQATGRVQYTDATAAASMPRGGTGTETVTVEFFNFGHSVSDDELAQEYEKRSLTPDPYAVAAVNEADPAFADKYPNGTHWKDADGKWCFAAFGLGDGGRFVLVNRYSNNDWYGRWWFGGVRKLSA